MTRLMTGDRWRDANAWFFGMRWRAVVVLAVAYVAVRML